jgi:hypothetical protein
VELRGKADTTSAARQVELRGKADTTSAARQVELTIIHRMREPLLHDERRSDERRSELTTMFIQPTNVFSTTGLDELSRRTHYINLVVNVALLVSKAIVYAQCRSMAILAALMDSIVDLLTQALLIL